VPSEKRYVISPNEHIFGDSECELISTFTHFNVDHFDQTLDFFLSKYHDKRMKLFFPLILLFACSHRPPLLNKKDDLVHVSTVMDQVQQSYMKGCVDVYQQFKLGRSFEACKVKAKEHRLNIQSILDQDH
jgi:hypothetical protein